MTQVIKKDSLGVLTDFGTYVRLTDARIIIGGRQYTIALLDDTYPALVDGTLYGVYATAVAQTPALVVSTTPPSAPYVIVGSFLYTTADGVSFASLGAFGAGFTEATTVDAGVVKLPNGTVWMDTGSNVSTGHGSAAPKIRNFINVGSSGDAFTASSDNTNGALVTVNRDCVVAINYIDADTLANDNHGITINGNVSTDLTSHAVYDGSSGRLTSVTNQANGYSQASATIRVSVGDEIRPHTNGSQNSSVARVQFIVQEIARL